MKRLTFLWLGRRHCSRAILRLQEGSRIISCFVDAKGGNFGWIGSVVLGIQYLHGETLLERKAYSTPESKTDYTAGAWRMWSFSCTIIYCVAYIRGIDRWAEFLLASTEGL